MIKYVFIQNDPFYLPKVLDKFLREFRDTTAGINIQSVAQGKRSVVQTARDLYRLNRLRIIPTADYKPVPLYPAVNPDTGKPLDMSFCLLRSISPVHMQYMQNMGTMASMSISILRDGSPAMLRPFIPPAYSTICGTQ